MFPSAKLLVNRIPPGFKKIESKNITEDLYFDPSRSRVVTKPRIGAFEVTIDRTIIFSKLECQRWPHIPSVLNAIKRHVEENQSTIKPIETISLTNQRSPEKSLKIKSSYSSSRPASRSKQSISTAFTIKDYSSIDNNFNFMGIIPENGVPSSKMNKTYDYRDSRVPSGESRISSLYFHQKMFTNNIPKSPLKKTHQEVDKDMRNYFKRSKMLLQQIPGAHVSGGFDPFLTADFSTNRSVSRGLGAHIKPLPRPLTCTFDGRSSSRIKGRSNTVDNRKQLIVLNNYSVDKKRRSLEDYGGDTIQSNINVLDDDTTKVLKENLLKTLTTKHPTPRVEKPSKRYDSDNQDLSEERNPAIEAAEKMALELLKTKHLEEPKEIPPQERSMKKDKSVDKSKIQTDLPEFEVKSARVEATVENLLERLEQAEEELKTARKTELPAYEEREYTHPNSCTENTPKEKPQESIPTTKEFVAQLEHGDKPELAKRKSSKNMLLDNPQHVNNE